MPRQGSRQFSIVRLGGSEVLKIELTLQFAKTGPVAFPLSVMDTIGEAAARFYEHRGFPRLSDALPSRMVLDLAPRVRA